MKTKLVDDLRQV